MFDYIYLLQDVIELEGSANSSKRRIYKKFLREYGEYGAAGLDLRQPANRERVTELLDIWYRQKGFNEIDAGHERMALNKLLAQAENFDLSAVGVYYEDQLIGFYASEIVGPEDAIGHFKKGDYRYGGIFEILAIENANHLLQAGCKYLNEQQDLGLKGLRRSKLSWNPARFLKKYKVAARQ